MPCFKKFNNQRKIPFTSEQKEIIFGCMLGDMTMRKGPRNINWTMIICHSLKQENYFKWKMNKFVGYFGPNAIQYRKTKDSYETYTAESITLPELEQFGNKFYKNKIKIIPDDFEECLTPLSLAMWIGDDGTINVNTGHGYSLATMCFTYDEHWKIIKAFNKKFNLNPRMAPFNLKNKGITYNRISFSMKDSKVISNMISPYLIDTLGYKLF